MNSTSFFSKLKAFLKKPVGILVLVVVIAGVAGAVYYFQNQNSETDVDSYSSCVEAKDATLKVDKDKATCKTSDGKEFTTTNVQPSKQWKYYSELGLTFNYPSDWRVTKSSRDNGTTIKGVTVTSPAVDSKNNEQYSVDILILKDISQLVPCGADCKVFKSDGIKISGAPDTANLVSSTYAKGGNKDKTILFMELADGQVKTGTSDYKAYLKIGNNYLYALVLRPSPTYLPAGTTPTDNYFENNAYYAQIKMLLETVNVQ